jgi:hypothetical protein
MYLFTSTFSTDEHGAEVMKVETNVIGKKKPGLSAYAQSPADAVPPLLALFAKVRSAIPEDRLADTTVMVLGTAGMRSLEPSQRQPIYDAVRQGLTSSEEYVFSKDSKMLQLRSLSGTEEGTFAMLCVNFLNGRLDHHLRLTSRAIESSLLGILDLGGSSTQIAVPPTSSLLVGDIVPLSSADPGSASVRSYAAYGMEQMRERLDKLAVGKGMSSSPCYFRGYRDPLHSLSGVGDAQKCREMLVEVFSNAQKECPADDHECMPGACFAAANAGSHGMQFFAVSGYLFVTDFVSHWVLRNDVDGAFSRLKEAGNRPTILELEAASGALCLSDWQEIEKATAGGPAVGAHRYTDSSKAPHRCLEANYVVTLLRHAYGFPDDQRLVTFEDEVNGNEVEWPLGALLHARYEASLMEKVIGGQEL